MICIYLNLKIRFFFIFPFDLSLLDTIYEKINLYIEIQLIVRLYIYAYTYRLKLDLILDNGRESNLFTIYTVIEICFDHAR